MLLKSLNIQSSLRLLKIVLIYLIQIRGALVLLIFGILIEDRLLPLQIHEDFVFRVLALLGQAFAILVQFLLLLHQFALPDCSGE